MSLKIQVANISDSGYLGINETVTRLAPFLRRPERNPRATLITLFLNTIPEIIHRRGEKDTIPEVKALMDYLPTPSIASLLSPNSADSLRLWDTRSLALDVDEYFNGYVKNTPCKFPAWHAWNLTISNRYAELYGFASLAGRLGMDLETKNSIVEPWPTRLKLKQDGTWSQHEFNAILGSDFSCLERYVEWRMIL